MKGSDWISDPPEQEQEETTRLRREFIERFGITEDDPYIRWIELKYQIQSLRLGTALTLLDHARYEGKDHLSDVLIDMIQSLEERIKRDENR